MATTGKARARRAPRAIAPHDKVQRGKVYLSVDERSMLRAALRAFSRSIRESSGDVGQPLIDQATELHVKLGGPIGKEGAQ